MAVIGSLAPLMDESMKRSSFFLPIGVVPKEGSLPDYYASAAANGGQVATPARPRSHSNATLDMVDIRKEMTHSITNLFANFEIMDPADVISTILLLIQPRTDSLS